VRALEKKKAFVDGCAKGWQSVIGPKLLIPEIPLHFIERGGSIYIQGLMAGIEAAKDQMAELD
jgi:hypothetical protein